MGFRDSDSAAQIGYRLRGGCDWSACDEHERSHLVTPRHRRAGRHRQPARNQRAGRAVVVTVAAAAVIIAMAAPSIATESVSPMAASAAAPTINSTGQFGRADRAANRSRTSSPYLAGSTAAPPAATEKANPPLTPAPEPVTAAPEPPAATPAAARLPSWVLPAQGRYTSCFCERWGEMHGGIDLANANGTPELAAAAGTVIVAGPAGGFGQWVQLRHDDGTVTVYGHMDTIEVAVGQQVAAGQLIATMGAQGNSTGPHLHFEVWPAGDRALRIDPAVWLTERGVLLPEYTP